MAGTQKLGNMTNNEKIYQFETKSELIQILDLGDIKALNSF